MKYIVEVNEQSDFDFLFSYGNKGCVCDPEGESSKESFPTFDFEGELWPESVLELKENLGYSWDKLSENSGRLKVEPYVFSKKGPFLTNCLNNQGKVHVVVDNHHFPPGKLLMVLRSYYPNPLYPDGTKKEVKVYPLNICIVEGKGVENPCRIDVDVTVPYVYISAWMLAKSKGYKGSEEDFIRSLVDVGDIGDIARDLKKAKEDWDAEKDKYVKDDDLKNFVDGGALNPETLDIELKHGETVVAKIAAKGFYAGQLEHVRLKKGEASGKPALVFTFTKESGKEPIEVPLGMEDLTETDLDAFYSELKEYTKEEMESAISEIEEE